MAATYYLAIARPDQWFEETFAIMDCTIYSEFQIAWTLYNIQLCYMIIWYHLDLY